MTALLYHSPFKHFVKGLLGRKNDAWYFDRMVKAYDGKQQQLTRQILATAGTWALLPEDAEWPAEAIKHPLYDAAMTRRSQLLQRVQQEAVLRGKTVVFQMPPGHFSPGWASWFGSLAEAMRYMGADVHEVWQNWPKEVLGSADFLFAQANAAFTSRWPAHLKQQLKRDAVFACYCSFEQSDEQAARKLYEQLAAAGVNCLLNAADAAFIQSSAHSQWARHAAGLPILSLAFAANPLRHYPAPWYQPTADYVFLGSANYDKAKRYHDFFYPIIRKYKGVLAGQGWPWTKGYELNANRDRWMYASSRLGLNLHLQSQVDHPTELNERTYILFATGTPQLMDKPALMPLYLGDYPAMAGDPQEYLSLMNRAMMEPEWLWQIAEQTLVEVYKRHTVFDRISSFQCMVKGQLAYAR